MDAAIRGGVGFAPTFKADTDADLVPIGPAHPEWKTPVWIVTHVDLHRSAKVQAFLAALKKFG